MTTTRYENGETDNDNEGAERWCSTCEHHAEDCTCNPDGDETVAEYEARQAATAAPATDTLATKFERLEQDGAFTGNPKYDAVLKRLADTRLDDEELKRLVPTR